MAASTIWIGTAGWEVPAQFGGEFPGPGPARARYARRLPAVEINTTFYRLHREDTFAKWASLVPEGFRFAVKAPRLATHFHRLGPGADLAPFLAGAVRLGAKLGPVLVQLPPSLAFEGPRAGGFLERLRRDFAGDVVLEPRHPSWFAGEVDGLLRAFRVARVAADPRVVPAAGEPGGWEGLVYYRQHGWPEMYRSCYSKEYLKNLSEALERGPAAWCVFDNTAEGEAVANALDVLELAGVAWDPEPVPCPD
jgi:uncharacterized protein YecE (DUF72 family)